MPKTLDHKDGTVSVGSMGYPSSKKDPKAHGAKPLKSRKTAKGSNRKLVLNK